MSELRRNRRKLREVGRRIIVGAYKRGMRGRLGIISAPTGSGKTYNIQNTIIPDDIAEGNTHFLYLTTFTDSVAQELNDFKRSLRGKAEPTASITEFLNWDYEEEQFPIVLITTIQGAVNGGGQHENSDLLISFLRDKMFSVYWDEAHFGGSSSKETAKLNLGGGMPAEYKASYYKFCEALAKNENGKVTGFTATPLFEQEGLLRGIGGLKPSTVYAFLSKGEDWPTDDEFSDIASQIRLIRSYCGADDGKVMGLCEAINDFRSFSEMLKLKSAMISTHHPEIEFSPKPVMLINAGFGNSNGVTSIPMEEAINYTVDYLKDKINPDLKIFAKVTENGYFVGSINDIINQTWTPYSKMGGFKPFIKRLQDSSDPVQIVFHLEKFKVGLNLNNITHECHLRERNQSTPNGMEVVVSPIQIFGRSVRTWFGIKFKNADGKPCNYNYVSDAVDWLIENYSDSPVFDDLRLYMRDCNSHTFFVPDSATYDRAIEVWRDIDRHYAVGIEQSQFNILKTSESGEKLVSVPTGRERDLAYKKYKDEVRHCERHPDGSCKSSNRQFFTETDEEYEEAYWKALDVNHINGDRNDMNPENLETVCKTYHGITTFLEKHFLNNYENAV